MAGFYICAPEIAHCTICYKISTLNESLFVYDFVMFYTCLFISNALILHMFLCTVFDYDFFLISIQIRNRNKSRKGRKLYLKFFVHGRFKPSG